MLEVCVQKADVPSTVLTIKASGAGAVQIRPEQKIIEALAHHLTWSITMCASVSNR